MLHRKSCRAPITALTLLTLTPTLASADPIWVPTPNVVFNDPLPGYWSTNVELADLDGDGLVDVLFANVGGAQSGTPDSILSNQAFRNEGPGTKFTDISLEIFGEDPNNPGLTLEDTARVIKAADVDKDGDTDLLIGTTWATKSNLYINDNGVFVAQPSLLPNLNLSAGDLEVGDVDGDGDLDVVISDWGPAPVGFVNSPGGITRLWLNDGSGMFTDATATKMPAIPVNWSWDHDFIDLDNDYDLDLIISCRACAGGSLAFTNDGTGKFANTTGATFPSNLIGSAEFEVMDIDGDGDVDAVSLQDGPGFSNRVFLNDGAGVLDGSQTAFWWPAPENPTSFDFGAAFLDYDSDGRPDLLLGGFAKNPDRLMRNEGTSFKGVTTPSPFSIATDGTYAVAVGHLNDDFRLDVVFAEGENVNRNRIFFADAAELDDDTAPPVIGDNWEFGGKLVPDGVVTFRARIHDNKSPNRPLDWTKVALEWVTDGGSFDNPGDITGYDLEWYGEYLWRTQVEDDAQLILPTFESKISIRACAIDAAGNETCVMVVQEHLLCGDGELNSPLEVCDDGNQVDGDGCEANCQLTIECGNGVVQGSEQCDDGNLDPGDGCDEFCQIEGDETTTTDTTSTSTSGSESDSDSDTMTTSASATDGTATMTATDSATDSDSDSATTFDGALDDDGCGCRADNSRGLGSALLLLGLLGLRRRRRA
ncbi:MAG: VCBS repeat-containing protein [Nannocystis sp.]|nr:VCBS repeat-containing protein [Nannocystis sp.]